MAIISLNSFRFDSQGWLLSNTTRTPGAGQNGIASIRATLGADASATFGFPVETEIIVGFCVRYTNAGAGTQIMRFQTSGAIAASLTLDSDGSVIFYRGNSSVELGRTLPGVYNNSVELYVECRILCSATVGEVEVRFNGNPTPLINLTGVNTGSSSLNQVVFYSQSAGTRDHSAFYLLDTSGPAPHNTFLGHIRYAVLLPTAEGVTTGWTPLSGTDNALMVDDDSAPDGNTTYNAASNVGDKDTYVTGDMPTASTTILAVQPVLHAAKSDAGVRALNHVIRSNGVDYPGAIDQYLGSSYTAFREPVLEDPDTSAPWTDAAINAMQVGVEVAV